MANLSPQQITLLRSQLQSQIITQDEHDEEDATNLLDYALDMLIENGDGVDVIVQEVCSCVLFCVCEREWGGDYGVERLVAAD